jgi:hypothetical protein
MHGPSAGFDRNSQLNPSSLTTKDVAKKTGWRHSHRRHPFASCANRSPSNLLLPAKFDRRRCHNKGPESRFRTHSRSIQTCSRS